MIETLTAIDHNGTPLQAVTLRSDHLRARILTSGASLQDLRLEGCDHPLVLGYEDPTHYLSNPPYLGAIVGRVANRLSGGSVMINGQRHLLDCNEGQTTCLHGGTVGFSHHVWQITDHSPTHVTLELVSPDGDMGFPGRLAATATYHLLGPRLCIALTATSDAPTVCNLAPHIYFNLDGSRDISRHRLSVAAGDVLPVENGLPLSSPVPAQSLGLDMTRPRSVPDGLDHHYCLSDAPTPLRKVAVLSSSVLSMRVETTEPGLQVYDGSGLDIAKTGLGGRSYGRRAGIALEPHRWIDAPNQPWHRQTRLHPGETYQAQTVFGFTTAGTPAR